MTALYRTLRHLVPGILPLIFVVLLMAVPKQAGSPSLAQASVLSGIERSDQCTAVRFGQVRRHCGGSSRERHGACGMTACHGAAVMSR